MEQCSPLLVVGGEGAAHLPLAPGCDTRNPEGVALKVSALNCALCPSRNCT